MDARILTKFVVRTKMERRHLDLFLVNWEAVKPKHSLI